MSTNENKALVRRLYEEGMNAGDASIIEEVLDPECVAHFPGVPPIRGREGRHGRNPGFLAAFPDIRFVIEQQVAETDLVATRWTARGTHEGEFRGFPPTRSYPATGRPVAFGATDIYRISAGRVVEEWNTFEQLDALRQIGVVAMPE
jgi:predicted SnoaL-like aldol condensation-catalyzing enzyme